MIGNSPRSTDQNGRPVFNFRFIFRSGSSAVNRVGFVTGAHFADDLLNLNG